MQTRPRLDWRPILLEAGFVVLGVILALAANEWRRSYNERQGAATAVAGIRDELAANRAAVLESARYHIQLWDTLHALNTALPGAASAGPALPDVRLFSRGFFAPAQLLHTAWDAAEATGAVRHMSFDTVIRLARVYEEQDSYRRQSEQVGQLLYSRLLSDGVRGVIANHANMNTVIAAFWYRECQLLHRYDEMLPHPAEPLTAEHAAPDRCAAVPPR